MEIQGLTALQTEIANKLWGLDSMEEVAEFIASLPGNLQREAMVIQEMMIAAAVDEVMDTDLAEQILANIAK